MTNGRQKKFTSKTAVNGLNIALAFTLVVNPASPTVNAGNILTRLFGGGKAAKPAAHGAAGAVDDLAEGAARAAGSGAQHADSAAKPLISPHLAEVPNAAKNQNEVIDALSEATGRHFNDLAARAAKDKLSRAVGREKEIRGALTDLSRGDTFGMVLSGGPNSGKTTLLHELQRKFSKLTAGRMAKAQIITITSPPEFLTDLDKLGPFIDKAKATIPNNGQKLLFHLPDTSIISESESKSANALRNLFFKLESEFGEGRVILLIEAHLDAGKYLADNFLSLGNLGKGRVVHTELKPLTKNEALLGLRHHAWQFGHDHGVVVREEVLDKALQYANGDFSQALIYLEDAINIKVTNHVLDEKVVLDHLEASLTVAREQKAKALTAIRDAQAAGKKAHNAKDAVAKIDQKIAKIEKSMEDLTEKFTRSRQAAQNLRNGEGVKDLEELGKKIDLVLEELKSLRDQVARGVDVPEETINSALQRRDALLAQRENIVLANSVEVEDLALAVSKKTGQNLDAVLNLSSGFFTREQIVGFLKSRVVGQDRVIEIVADVLLRLNGPLFKIKPAFFMVFLGLPGIGKSELMKAIADLMYDGRMVMEAMAHHKSEVAGTSLFGAPAGYKGYGEGGLVGKINSQGGPALIGLDELERGHYSVYEGFLTPVEEGHIIDTAGRRANIGGRTGIVGTSNLGDDLPTDIPFEEMDRLGREALRKSGRFPDAFINRMSHVLVFKSLPEGEWIKIYNIFIEKQINKQLLDYNMSRVVVTEKARLEILRNMMKKNAPTAAAPAATKGGKSAAKKAKKGRTPEELIEEINQAQANPASGPSARDLGRRAEEVLDIINAMTRDLKPGEIRRFETSGMKLTLPDLGPGDLVKIDWDESAQTLRVTIVEDADEAQALLAGVAI